MKKYVACMITFWFTCVMLCLVVTCVYADNPVGRLKAGDFNGFLDDALRTNWFNGMATAGASAVIASMLSGLVGAAAGAGVGGATGSINRTNTSKITGNTVQPPYTRKKEFNTDGSTDTSRSGTRILDGKDAISWMQDKDNGYIDKDGLPTKKFHEFMNSLFSQKGSGLQGFCGDIDADGNPTGDYVIIVDDDAPAAQADDSRDTNKISDDDVKNDGSGGDDEGEGGGGDDEGGGGDEGTGDDEVVVAPPIDYLIGVKEDEISLQEEDKRKKELNLKKLNLDIKKLKKEIEIVSEVEFQNSIINLIDFAFGTFINISAPSWTLDLQKSLNETLVRYKKTGKLPSYEDFKKFLNKQMKEYVDEKSGKKIKTAEEVWGEIWDTTYSGVYSKLKEFDDYREKREKLSKQLESRRTRRRADKDEIETLQDELEENKHQLDLLRIKRGDTP